MLRRFYRHFVAGELWEDDVARIALAMSRVSDGRFFYQSLIFVVENVPAAEKEFVLYVRDLFPRAPSGFEWIGKKANAPRRLPIAPSPRLVALPDPVFGVNAP